MKQSIKPLMELAGTVQYMHHLTPFHIAVSCVVPSIPRTTEIWSYNHSLFLVYYNPSLIFELFTLPFLRSLHGSAGHPPPCVRKRNIFPHGGRVSGSRYPPLCSFMLCPALLCSVPLCPAPLYFSPIWSLLLLFTCSDLVYVAWHACQFLVCRDQQSYQSMQQISYSIPLQLICITFIFQLFHDQSTTRGRYWRWESGSCQHWTYQTWALRHQWLWRMKEVWDEMQSCH